MNNNRLVSLREKTAKLPFSPGVYLMKDKQGKIIYIGKAKQLRNRVSSYFAETHQHSFKTVKLVENIHDFDYIVTLKELDALVLESSLIKQHRPKYNILLKDARGFNYVKISPSFSKGDYQRLSYTHNAEDKACDYIGPYANGFTIRQSVIDVNRIFMLPSCTRKFPDEIGKNRPCLNYQIKRCIGVCLGGITREDYRQRVKSAIDYIKKGSKESIRRLTAEMNEAAESLDFERAARLRDQIAAIKRTDSVQSVQSKKTSDYDIIALARNNEVVCAAVVKYSGGRLIDKESFRLGEIYESEPQMLRDFLLEYYAGLSSNSTDNSGERIVSEIYLEIPPEDSDLLEEHLKLKITIPKRGEGLSQVMLAKNNASEFLAVKTGRKSKETAVLESLSKVLGLEKPPEIIECYDISNIGESVKVGGLVCFKNGSPFKKGYRKFIIKEVEGLDDYACMREVVRRRFTRLLARGEEPAPPNEPYSTPDLILLDGGGGHVSTVKGVLEELGLKIPLFGLVKDSKHKTRAVSSIGGEIEIFSNKGVFTFLTKLQDEVHRFSVTFAREKHKKSSFALTLTQVPGIGEAKANALLKQFKTKQALREAQVEQLAEIAKINTEKAQELKNYIDENF